MALIKIYAVIEGVLILNWSRRRIESFITSNVEPKYKKLFRDYQIKHKYSMTLLRRPFR